MKITVDVMESKTMVLYLQRLGCEVEIKDLRSPYGRGGDYTLGDGKIGIERKSVKDLILSLIQQPDKEKRSKHLYEQLNKLKNYDTGILLIEGFYPTWEDDWHVQIGGKKYTIHKNTLFGIVVWCIRNGIFVIHSNSLEESARIITLYAKKLSLQLSRTAHLPEEDVLQKYAD